MGSTGSALLSIKQQAQGRVGDEVSFEWQNHIVVWSPFQSW